MFQEPHSIDRPQESHHSALEQSPIHPCSHSEWTGTLQFFKCEENQCYTCSLQKYESFQLYVFFWLVSLNCENLNTIDVLQHVWTTEPVSNLKFSGELIIPDYTHCYIRHQWLVLMWTLCPWAQSFYHDNINQRLSSHFKLTGGQLHMSYILSVQYHSVIYRTRTNIQWRNGSSLGRRQVKSGNICPFKGISSLECSESTPRVSALHW